MGDFCVIFLKHLTRRIGKMIYGLIFLGHAKAGADVQRNKLLDFAKKRNLKIDRFISYEDSPNFADFLPGDTVICYAWNCICKTKPGLNTFLRYAIKNKICIFSVTSKYGIGQSVDWTQLENAFDLYEDIRFNFLSHKNTAAASRRVENGHAPGRPMGSKNTKHILDGKEKAILDMYNSGASMYAISKKMQVSAPTIKRFLTTQN